MIRSVLSRVWRFFFRRTRRKKTSSASRWRIWVSQLFEGPDAKADEMAFIALLIGISFVASTAALICFEAYWLIARHGEWRPGEFAMACATIYGAGGPVISLLAIAMGKKAQLGG